MRKTPAPPAPQRRTTAGSGKPNRFRRPQLTTANAARAWATNPGVDEVRLPWWGTLTTSAGEPPSAASPPASRSPGNRTRRPAKSTRTTRELSLTLARGSGSAGPTATSAAGPPPLSRRRAHDPRARGGELREQRAVGLVAGLPVHPDFVDGDMRRHGGEPPEVIGVGMGQHRHVDSADPVRAEKRPHRPLARVGSLVAEQAPTGVDEPDRAPRLHHRRVSLSHVEKRDPQPVRSMRPPVAHRDGDAAAGHDPSPSPPQRDEGDQQEHELERPRRRDLPHRGDARDVMHQEREAVGGESGDTEQERAERRGGERGPGEAERQDDELGQRHHDQVGDDAGRLQDAEMERGERRGREERDGRGADHPP